VRDVLFPGKLWVKLYLENLYNFVSDFYLVICDTYGGRKVFVCGSPALRKVNQLVLVRSELCPVFLYSRLAPLISYNKSAIIIRCACVLSNQIGVVYKLEFYYIVLGSLEFFE
jgi:hypothetical protein